MILNDSSWTSYSPSSHRPLRAFYFSIIAIFTGIPSRSFCGGESVQTVSLTSKCFCVLVKANSCGFRVSFHIVWVRFCFNYSSFLCPISPTFIPLYVQEIIKKIGSLPWTSIIDFSFPGNHDKKKKIARLSCDFSCTVLWSTVDHGVLVHLILSTDVLSLFFCSFLDKSTPSEASTREQARSANKEWGTIKSSIRKISV